MARRSVAAKSDQTILVVDDHEEMLVSVSTLLEREGHRVLTARSAESALALFKSHDVDLLLVDYMMPRVSGADLVREIRALDPFVQIILQTGFAGELPPRAMIAGMDIQGYHDKTEGPEKLLVWVDAGLKVNRLIKAARPRLTGQASMAVQTCVLFVGEGPGLGSAEQTRIEQDGHRVVRVGDSSAGLAMILSERPDVLIVEERLLASEDADLLRRIRAISEFLPILAVVREATPERRREFIDKLGLHGVYDPAGGVDSLAEAVAITFSSLRLLRQAGADHQLRELIIGKFCHDLRNALHVIRGYAEILREEQPPSSGEGVLGRLEIASDTALGLAEDYLDLARLEEPGVRVVREAVDINSLLDDLRVFGLRQRRHQPVDFTTDIVSPGSFLVSDAEKLRAILTHLLANAIKLTLSRKIHLSVHGKADQTEFVLIDRSASDERDPLAGVQRGPDPSTIEAKATTPGQGVGLAIAMRLSAMLGASLTTHLDTTGSEIVTLTLPVGIHHPTDSIYASRNGAATRSPYGAPRC